MAQSVYLSRHRRMTGFTLVEVLVAVAIMAMLSVLVFQALDGVQRSNQVSQTHSARLEALQRTLVMMDADFRQIMARKVRLSGEDAPSELLLIAGEYMLDSASQGIMFTRAGWQNPQQMFPRGENVRVGYRVIEEELQRVYFRYPDVAIGEEWIVTPLLDGVEALEFEFYVDESWSPSWAGEGDLPAAIRLTLTLKDYREIERVYVLPDVVVQQEVTQ
ncbi:type II secretion system minor pseudopilin GspJ [Thaumasiovibrio sp. DFM-14]|uniref:type II secretion system minor pseudopilin GspJ n=1 Tax=Thaumasiovibrio sp. DFM-14 TaxID=3384792 RepID=UPI0039A1050C